MKKLSLLKPDVRTGYLEDGKGQEVTYLDVSDGLNIKSLEQDIKNGATQFQSVREFLKKKPSKFVVVSCKNEEQGLAAVSYLAACYNHLDKLARDEDDEQYIDEELDITFEDYDDDDPLGLYDDEDDKEWESENHWEENPWRIPIVHSSEISNDGMFGINSFGNGPFGFGAQVSPKVKLPYWYYARKENICIVHRVGSYFYDNSVTHLLPKLKRFKNNRHVFMLVVDMSDNLPFDEIIPENSVKKSDNGIDWNETGLWEFVLEYAAGTLDVPYEEDKIKNYYNILFENWVDNKGYSLAKRFPVAAMTKSIISMNNLDKSGLLEKVINYVVKDIDTPRALTTKDFDVLKYFKLFGEDEKKEHKNLNKLEEELVGMEDVKRQIHGIVEVMKYNKRRERLGLKSGKYHNVHMMIGAPGTAKTTMAELLGKIMEEERLLKGSKFVSVNGAELKGMYVGHSAPKVKALFDNYDIILIDEAYAVAAGRDGDTDSFSQEAVAQLIIELEKHGMDRLVIFAGYGGVGVTEKDNKMKLFLESNPGIKSRINSTIYFESYTAEEMVEIFKCHAKMNQYVISNKADALVREFFLTRIVLPDFGNGREARSLLENATVEAAMRLSRVPEDKITAKMYKELLVEDIEAAICKMSESSEMQKGRKARKLGFAV